VDESNPRDGGWKVSDDDTSEYRLLPSFFGEPVR
jgi:hypothetical protein